MQAELQVFQAVPAPQKLAIWLKNAIDKYMTACRFSDAWPAIELRPMNARGWAQRSEADRRICVSSRAVFWSSKDIALVCLHEVAHRLVFDFENDGLKGIRMAGHGPVFFLTLATLYKRVDLELKSESQLSNYLDVYCLQDRPNAFENWQPHEWIPAVMSWALVHSQALAESLHPAEKIPSLAADLWIDYSKQCTQKKDDFQALQVKNEELELKVKELNQSCTFYAVGGLLAIVFVVAMSICINVF